LSASWATRKYFWAIADGNGAQQNFRLSQDARLLDFHQKTLYFIAGESPLGA